MTGTMHSICRLEAPTNCIGSQNEQKQQLHQILSIQIGIKDETLNRLLLSILCDSQGNTSNFIILVNYLCNNGTQKNGEIFKQIVKTIG